VGAIFFLLLMVAALTSAISMLEVPASYFIDEKHWSRKKAACVVAIITFIVGIPSALSYGGMDFFTNMSVPTLDGDVTSNGWFGILDYYFGTVFIVVVALATAIYVGWIMKIDRVVAEIKLGSEIFSKKIAGLEFSVLWSFFIKYVCPIVIALVFLNMIGVFGEPGGGG